VINCFDRRCGIFGGPLNTRRAHAYWERASPDYAPDAQRGLVRFTAVRQHEAALRLSSLHKGARVLDAGAGTGLLTRRLIERGVRGRRPDERVGARSRGTEMP